jgi:ABC-2 type transport system ATP-binding protein
MDQVLNVDSLSVTLGGIPILRNISFSLERGDIAWLIGPNGAGKSTLLRAVASLLPFEGDISIGGFDSYQRAARSCFTYAADVPVLYEDLTLGEQAIFASRAWGRPESITAIHEILRAFQLTDRLDEFPVTHSRGMQQKLSLALAIGVGTPLLMLDEPYDGLDRRAQPILTELLLRHADTGGAVLVTTHQEHQIDPFLGARSVRVLELEDGTLGGDSAMPRFPGSGDRNR